MAKGASDSIMTPAFRVSFPNVFEPRLNELNGKQEFSVTALFKKGENLDRLKLAVLNCIKAKWGADKELWPKGIKLPFRDQGEKAKVVEDQENPGQKKSVLPDGYEKGATFITLRSTQKPGVVDQNVTPILSPADFYAGMWAQATCSVYAYEAKGKTGGVLNRGVGFGLRNIQKVKDDEPLSGKRKAEQEFQPIQMEEGAAAPSDLSDLSSLSG